MSSITVACIECGAPFEREVKRGRPPIYCDACRTIRAVEARRRSYRDSSARRRESSRVWYADPANREPCPSCGQPMGYMKGRAPSGATCQDCRSAAASIVGDPNHGNKRGYRINGCRCEACREWKNAQMRAYAARVKARDGVSPTQKARPAKPKSCIRCGESIKGRAPSSYCNPCGHEVRKRSQKGNWITKERRRALYERDNWTCQLCGEPVDPSTYGGRYPTLDHIEPQSLALIPDHSDRNLRTAHLSCNAKRGNRAA